MILGDTSKKHLKKYEKDVAKIKEIEAVYKNQITTIDQVQAKTHSFMSQFEWLDYRNDEDFKKIDATLNSIKHEAIALHRRACELIYGQTFEISPEHTITWNMIPYDVQIIGGLALHDRNIAEMRTGEWKTLVATIPAYLNALTWLPIHIVTVNDYLARRDASEMGIIYKTLGLSVGVITHNQDQESKKIAYKSNIVYATNNELGFDYLRDNMAIHKERKVMGPLFLAIVDEVDSILIDEARTPLIISAPDTEPTTKYTKFAAIARNLENNIDYKIDEKQRTATLTEDGIKKIEWILGVDNIYVSQHYNDIHHIENALKAHSVFRRDVDYLVRNDEILIIDEHTGRVLSWRRYSDGLHQALEAKENVTIQQESKTLASITFQNYFRLYKKLAWMTGTAKTEEEEFYKIYRLEVITIPTNRPMIRHDRSDILFRSERWKYQYVVRLIKELHKHGQPVLVGTVSVAKSEYLSELLVKEWVPHEVLNAKQDIREAEIIAQAGRYGAVTIATNMAGRGTDIKIDDQVRSISGKIQIEWAAGIQEYPLGWLFVIGTEKHETRRIDNQLRWRSGRQGDPGLSQFMLSPQDDIMRVFWGNKLFSILSSFESHPEWDPLVESKMLTRNILTIQKQVEWRNFDVRKHILEYDDVLNHHRLAIYSRRNRILEWENIHSEIVKMLSDEVTRIVTIATDSVEFIDSAIPSIVTLMNEFAEEEIVSIDTYTGIKTVDHLCETSITALLWKIEKLKKTGSDEEFYEFERRLTLATIDELWMNHIDTMAHLREDVAFEGYAQKNPLIVYKERAYEKFMQLISDMNHRVSKWLLTAKPREAIEEVKLEETLMHMFLENAVNEHTSSENALLANESDPQAPAIQKIVANDSPLSNETFENVGRNDLCPCGSGKKYKQCHGKN